MAKKSKSRSGAISSSPIARPRLPDLYQELAARIARQATARLLADRLRRRELERRRMLEVEDRRRFHPSRKFRSAASFSRPHHVLKVKSSRALSARVAFSAPKKVLVCVRRKRRKEVLHAKRVAGRGGLRRPRRSWFSDVSCR